MPFSRRGARAAGIPDSRLRAKDLVAPYRGVRHVRNYPDDVFWRARAYRELMSSSAVFSHATAARLYALPLPLYVDDRLHVSVPAGVHPPAGRGIVGHEIDGSLWTVTELIHHDHDRGELFTLPIATAPLVWAELAERLDREDLVALGDAMHSTEPPLASPGDLRRIAESWVGRRGSKNLAWAVPRLRARSWSRPESLFRLMMDAAGIPEPELNAVVHDLNGEPIATADFGWPRYRVLAEYEGDGHRSPAKFRSDITRYENYADGGWTVTRIHADDVFSNPNPALGRLARRLIAAGWNPGRRELRVVASARR